MLHHFAALLLAVCQAPPAQAPAPSAPAAQKLAQTADVQVEIVRVVDGDTIHVRLDGAVEKLRLLCVDTEEKIGTGAQSATKPGTAFGEETALWAREFFAGLGHEGAPAKIGLRFPRGERRRDNYGRLLVHVLLPDGEDYNLKIVREGRSPYFTKYGRSALDHAGFVAAQEQARKRKLGIWDPRTNVPAASDAPSARRPYERLLPWWDARAEAVAAFEARRAKEPDALFEAELPAALERAAAAPGEALVFGEVGGVFEEPDGSRTVLLRTIERDRALRVRIPRERVEAFAALHLDQAAEEFRQNYVWYRGRIERHGTGFESRATEPRAFERAGPEPALPAGAEGKPGGR